jgi:DNA-binding transcriptional ArsR family regulator
MAENILILEPGDERAQKIAKAMGSKTASDILHLLAEGPTSLTDIGERLSVPMNTAKYHVENLLEAGLISIAETKYSVKGREVKLYTLANQMLIVAPRQSSMRSLILKYASLFGIVVLATLVIAAFGPLLGPGFLSAGSPMEAGPQVAAAYDGSVQNFAPGPLGEIGASNMTAGSEAVRSSAKAVNYAMAANMTPEPSPALVPALHQIPPEAAGYATAPSPDLAFAFFFGGLLVIFILLCYEAWLWKRK